VQTKFERFAVRGFAGADYSGPSPDWLPIMRCDVRAKNGADFLLAFEAGRVAQSMASNRDNPPIIVIISSDCGLSIVVKELMLAGIPSYMILNVSELDMVVNELVK
jgi:hypothetical protein